MNVIRSMAAVTTRIPACRMAAIPAASSHSRMITPPCTLPAVLASATPIQWVTIAIVSWGRRWATGAVSLGGHKVSKSQGSTTNARTRRTILNCRQGEDLEASRPGRGSRRDARLRLPEAGRAASEREEGHRGRGHVQEAPSDAAGQAQAERGEARHPGAHRAGAGPRGPRADGAGAQERRADRAPIARLADPGAREPADPADREREEAAREGRGLPDQEGGHQGAVLRLRGPGPDLRGCQRRGRADGRSRAGHAARRG